MEQVCHEETVPPCQSQGQVGTGVTAGGDATWGRQFPLSECSCSTGVKVRFLLHGPYGTVRPPGAEGLFPLM